MLVGINVNLDIVEALLVFWQTIKEKNKVSELFILDVIDMPGFKYVYDDNFDAESVRRALSAITNREAFKNKNRMEGRFYSNNLWMLEDLNYTDKMIQPLKKLNLTSLVGKLNYYLTNELKVNSKSNQLEVIFSPLHVNEYLIKENKLIVNFFKVNPNEAKEDLYVGEKILIAYIEDRLKELLKYLKNNQKIIF